MPESQTCGICDRPPGPRPRLTVRQDRHYDCPLRHEIGLCAEHGAALQNGALPLHPLLFDWTHRHQAELYDRTHLVLFPGRSVSAAMRRYPRVRTNLPCTARRAGRRT